MSFRKLEEVILTAPTSIVELGGANWNSNYDNYVVVYHQVQPDTDNVDLYLRVLKSSSQDTTANYDQTMRVSTGSTRILSNMTYWQSNNNGTGSGEFASGNLWLFNFNNNSEYSYVTLEQTDRHSSGSFSGAKGGLIHTATSSSNGISFQYSSGNINTGAKFTLFGLLK